MKQEQWDTQKICKCGTLMRVHYTIVEPTEQGIDVIERLLVAFQTAQLAQ